MRADEQAYPVPDNVAWDKSKDGIVGGLTIREYFVAAAMQGLCKDFFEEWPAEYPEEIAKSAIKIADATIAAMAADQEKVLNK